MAPQFAFRNIEIWGTVISIQIPEGADSRGAFSDACENATSFYKEIDQTFSPFKTESEVSRLRSGQLAIADASPEVKLVWNKCLELRYLTQRAFDPWAVPGGFDPSGFVKGWAAQESLRFFDEKDIKHIQINAGGDVVVRGGIDENTPWNIGVRHPDFADSIAKTFEIFDGAIASSGTYERGAHIIDPYSGLIAIGARSATVLGPDGGLADAMATALMVTGDDGAKFFGQPELAEYSAWCIDRHEGSAWGVGPALAEEINAQ